jgi:hypothetical protein
VFEAVVSMVDLYRKPELTDMYTEVLTLCLHYYSQEDLAEKLLPVAVNYSQREEA